MSKTLTIRVDDDIQAQIEKLVELSGKTQSQIVREALRRQLSVGMFDELRRRLAPLAEARGWLTDEDVFENIS